VEVIMPLGSDPHDFAPSARQAEAMEQADLLVVNGVGFEEGMAAIIENAQDAGTPTFTFADHVELIELTGVGDEHADEEHTDEEHADEGDEHAGDEDEHGDEEHADEGDEHAGDEDGDEEHGHADGSTDPHIFTDPARMAAALGALGERLGQLEGIDTDALRATLDGYVDELDAVDAEIEAALAPVADHDRRLVTNHEVFGYFADRYDFDVVGAVVPSLTTNAQASAADITTLADVVRDTGVPAIFADNTQSTQLAEALADEVGGNVEVVELFSESLGEPGSGGETYLEMMRTNAVRIAAALT
ncbi:MAG: zinc ABC transporter substrate-binding protein, partial [Actinomycetota bacterium]|nr:zinc ABC transporter substrate-binding protein [Actinomycetota bacterium]